MESKKVEQVYCQQTDTSLSIFFLKTSLSEKLNVFHMQDFDEK